MTLKRQIIILLMSVLTLASCANEDLVFKINNGDPLDKSEHEVSVDFSVIKTQILEPSCTSCHSRFADYNVVKSRAAGIQDSIVNNRMPKGKPALTDAEKKLLAVWINAGMPESLEIATDLSILSSKRF